MYGLGEASKVLSTVTQNLGYFATVFDIWQLVYIIQQFLFSCFKGIHKCKLVNSPPVAPYAYSTRPNFIYPKRFIWTNLRSPIQKLLLLRSEIFHKPPDYLSKDCSDGNGAKTTARRWLFSMQDGINETECRLNGSLLWLISEKEEKYHV